MKKTIKNVLFITDDIRESLKDNIKEKFKQGNYYYDEELNKYSFDVIIQESFSDNIDKKWDVILIDFGLLDDNKKLISNIEILKLFYRKKIPMIWCGGLSNRYNGEAKLLFPKLKFLHDIPSVGLDNDDIMYELYQVLK